jgi:hypothetical protein
MKTNINLGLVLLLSLALMGCATSKTKKAADAKVAYPLTLAEIKQIDHALQKLKPGMTGEQMVAILDPTPLHHITPQSGGSSGNYFRAVYGLRPGYTLVLVEDVAAKPVTFIGYQKAGDSWLSPMK